MLEIAKINKSMIGLKIKKYRTGMNMSIETLADLSRHTTLKRIKNIENGRIFPNLRDVVDLCNALLITPDALLFDTCKPA